MGATPVRVTLSPAAHSGSTPQASRRRSRHGRAPSSSTPRRIRPAASTHERNWTRSRRSLTRASERNGRPILLLSDESYNRILFDGREFVSPALTYPHTLVLYTYGKQLLAPGERLGYVAISPSMRIARRPAGSRLFAQIVGGWQFPNTTLQRAVPDLETLSIDVPALQRRRDRMFDALTGLGYEVTKPEATFYMMVRSPIADDRRSPTPRPAQRLRRAWPHLRDARILQDLADGERRHGGARAAGLRERVERRATLTICYLLFAI